MKAFDKTLMTGAALALGLSISLTAVAQPTWFPSKFGASDELGAAN